MDARTISIALAALAAAAMPVVCHAERNLEPSLGAVAAVSSPTDAAQRASCGDDAKLSPLQRRLLAKYDQSVPVLVQYIWITRAIHLLEPMTTAQWAEAYRRRPSAC